MNTNNTQDQIDALGVKSITDLLHEEDAKIFTDALVEAMGDSPKLNVDIDQAKRVNDLTKIGTVGVGNDGKMLFEIASRAGGTDAVSTIVEKHAKKSKHLEQYAEGFEKLEAEVGTGNPTREAYGKMLESIRRAEAQSIVTGRNLRKAKTVQKTMRKALNPSHYTSKKEINAKKGKAVQTHKSRDHFGHGKDIIFIMGKDGQPKPISIKNAKKQGLI